MNVTQRHTPPPELAEQAAAYAAAHPHGSFTYLCCDRNGTPYYSHHPTGRVIYRWT